jgi:hypothetical protein
MKYKATETLPDEGIELNTELLTELRKIEDSVNDSEPDTIILKEWNSPPPKPRQGMMVLADGTNWDPGSGAGVYVNLATVWTKL